MASKIGNTWEILKTIEYFSEICLSESMKRYYLVRGWHSIVKRLNDIHCLTSTAIKSVTSKIQCTIAVKIENRYMEQIEFRNPNPCLCGH